MTRTATRTDQPVTPHAPEIRDQDDAGELYSEPVTETAFGTDVEASDARPCEVSHWIGDDPIGFTWHDHSSWATSAPYTGQDTTGYATEADALAALIAAYRADAAVAPSGL